MNLYSVVTIYFLIINIIAYASMGIDKRKAIKHEYRISEKTLFTLAIIGGSLGSILGMKKFRHKTKHWYFKYGMPAILIIQIALVIFRGQVLKNDVCKVIWECIQNLK